MKTVTIEQLLTWAFSVELPKSGSGTAGPSGVAGSSWSMVYDMGLYGTVIDARPNQWGVVADFCEQDAPHADAVLVGEAVMALKDAEVDVPEGWAPFPEWDDPHGLIAEAVAHALERWRLRPAPSRAAHIRTRVVANAVLKRRPDWRAEEPTVRMVMRGGKPAWFIRRAAVDAFGRTYQHEQNGFNARAGRPLKGAYRKFCLSDDLTGAVMERLDWQLWVSALETIAATVAPELTAHVLEPVRLSRAPWRHQPAA